MDARTLLANSLVKVGNGCVISQTEFELILELLGTNLPSVTERIRQFSDDLGVTATKQSADAIAMNTEALADYDEGLENITRIRDEKVRTAAIMSHAVIEAQNRVTTLARIADRFSNNSS